MRMIDADAMMKTIKIHHYLLSETQRTMVCLRLAYSKRLTNSQQ